MEESKRWIVTYTKHLRQKRKVYQDGIIEFHVPSNKVLLYDDDQKLLATRILKKDEVIESGATLAFETLLVDVGELDSTFKALQDMNASINQGQSRVKVERVQKSEGAFLVKKRHQEAGRLPNVRDNPVKVTEREWDVLYTAQVTQKAKKYHDGILKLVTSGSYMAQLILLKEDGSTLTSKFHKSSECLIIGNSYELPNYLVEICSQRNVPEGSDDKSLRRQVNSEAAMFTTVEVPLNKPRDAVQILSVLTRPREETISRDPSSPSRNLILSSPPHSTVPECEEEIPQGSSPAFPAALCDREDSCKIAVPDHEINEGSGLHVDVPGVPKQLQGSDKISLEESEERGESGGSFPSFDLGF